MVARRYAFGTGTQVLPIPELMPFRLTRQMAGVLAPHDALAVLAGPMAAAFAALRSGVDVLEVRRLQGYHALSKTLESFHTPIPTTLHPASCRSVA